MARNNQPSNRPPKGPSNQLSSSCHIVAIAARKGGVCKSTTAAQIAYELVRQHKRVLVIDTDDSGAVTDLLLPQQQAERGTADVLFHGAPIADVIVSTPSGVDLCAASPDMVNTDLLLAKVEGRETLLQQALAQVPGRWDFILVDCPPALGLATVNALVAATGVVSPCVPAYLNIKMITLLTSTMEQVREQLNPGLQMLGYLLCAVDQREGISEVARERLRKYAPELLWPVEIPVDTTLKYGPDHTRTSRGVLAYREATRELQRRLEISPQTIPQMVPQTNPQMVPLNISQTVPQTERSTS